MLTSETQIRVRYAETDMMGFVYHAHYLPWFEIGRTELFKQVGISYKELEAQGFRLPVLEVSVKYLKPAYYDDLITVKTTLIEKPLLRFNLTYEIKRTDELLTTGSSMHAFIDKEGRPVRPPQWAADLISKALKET
ncbi:MAG: thioesterase family protein [Verrucomicrobiota bacterium]|jgi:acyl-CoA thioester hydrolase